MQSGMEQNRQANSGDCLTMATLTMAGPPRWSPRYCGGHGGGHADVEYCFVRGNDGRPERLDRRGLPKRSFGRRCGWTGLLCGRGFGDAPNISSRLRLIRLRPASRSRWPTCCGRRTMPLVGPCGRTTAVGQRVTASESVAPSLQRPCETSPPGSPAPSAVPRRTVGSQQKRSACSPDGSTEFRRACPSAAHPIGAARCPTFSCCGRLG